MRRLAALVLLGALAGPATADEPAPQAPPAAAPDAFAEVVADAGLRPEDLGFRPKGTWNRYPVVVPWKLPFFDDLLADATATYEFTRTLGNVVEDVLVPETLAAAPKEGPGSLYRLGVALGTDRRIGGFRGFGWGLGVEGETPRSLVEALEDLRRRTGVVVDPLDDPPAGAPDLRALAAGVPEPLHPALSRLVTSMVVAHGWIERGLRRVTPSQERAIRAALDGLLEATPDASSHLPDLEDAAADVDEHSLHFGCLAALDAVQRARWALAAVERPAKGWPEFRLALPTAWGTLLFESGAVGHPVPADPFLVVRWGRAVRWEGPLGATGPGRRLSVALLLDGGDVGSASVPVAQGVLGCGIVLSAGAHDDAYRSGRFALGAGLLGMGVLVDEGGDDAYDSATGQGLGYAGAGLLLDAGGNDRYDLREGDGQGCGAPGGVGVLADRSGNDAYRAEPLPAKAGARRADYHSDGKIVGSNAQGCGLGRRGDLTDGHAWAGGLGALIDVDGDDRYEAGNFSQGVGYWFGTGLLWDGGGRDEYRSVYFSHGSGAHFAVGAVVDEGGDDLHLLADFPQVGLGPRAGAGLGFGWDVVNALLLDRAGNDRYSADVISLGCSNVRSHGWLIDEAGDDEYAVAEGALAFGAIDRLPTYDTPHRGAPFAFHLPQTSFFLDLGGADRYLRRPAAGGDPVADAVAGEGRTWGADGPRGPGGGPNVARGRDLARGRIGWLDAWPRRAPPAAK